MKKWYKVAGVLYVCEHGVCTMARKVLNKKQYKELCKLATDKAEGILK